MPQLNSEDRAQLREFLAERFNLDEMKTLCFDLGLDYEVFPHATKSELSRELIAYFERHDKMGCLVAAMVKVRPDEWLTQVLAQVSRCRSHEKVQIVLSNDKIKSRPDLKQKLAELLGISTDEVMIIATAPGSLKVLLGLPPREAGKLVALSLPYQLDDYEIIAVTPYVKLSPAAQLRWQTAVMGIATRTTTTAIAGGLSPGVKIVIGILLIAVLVLVGVVVWRSRQPELMVHNQCAEPLPIPAPDAVKSLLSLPQAIPPAEAIMVPIITGEGIYELTMTRGGMMVLRLPQPMPGIGLAQVELGEMSADTAVTLNGQPLNPPQRFSVRSGWVYELVICAPR